MKNSQGISAPELLEQGWDKDRLRNAAAALKQARRIDIQPHPTQGVVFIPIAEELASRFQDLSDEHRAVYKLVSDAASQGIWAKDLASKSKIPAGTLARLTKTLEHRKLIKQITPAQYRSRKVWMLFELEPNTELSGGSWYKDGQIDSELIDRLRSSTLEYISNCDEPVSAEDVQAFLVSQQWSRSIENVESIIRTLVLDRERSVVAPLSMNGSNLYHIRRKSGLRNLSSSFFSQIPCVSCPVRNQCSPGNNISPETCQYMNRWVGLKDVDDIPF
jgi:DNA-directed RNA polymerase III subunit RPC6